MSQPLQSSESPTRSRRLVDVAYEQLRDDLISLTIEPGSPLNEKELAERLGTGLTPVRDAIKRLALERLVVTFPRRGTFATDISVGDEAWLTEVRVELEGLAAAQASIRATQEERDALVQIVRTHPDAHHRSSGYLEIDTTIHRMIYAAAHNPFLADTLNQYANLSMRIWNFGLQRMVGTATDNCDQAEVVAAIAQGDADAAREAARAHLRDFSVSVRRMLNQ
ncbi:FCD domain-containing protein [Gordonia sp. HNM0687]|uniref:FCD domain-containing protein n=1 Tax=Gordonia mangrovi TaxID=2665643 RepID=A0A6L7GIX1_9ACTN|nr:GntR family transcriptional regulator [Gordonia mangrovi]MXP19796.1 FCD domain-containing protein [Gordonia mangrovi]UVF79577.1 GntR family transcriptional regulator [Gordonia mangrovi]